MTRRESLVRLAGPSSPRLPRAFRIVRWVEDSPPVRAAVGSYDPDTSAAAIALWGRELAKSVLGKSFLFKSPGE